MRLWRREVKEFGREFQYRRDILRYTITMTARNESRNSSHMLGIYYLFMSLRFLSWSFKVMLIAMSVGELQMADSAKSPVPHRSEPFIVQYIASTVPHDSTAD
jgi:hypothetical protein